MKKKFLCLLFVCQTSFAFNQKDFENLISLDDLKALQGIIVSTIASCPDKIVTNPADIGYAKRELLEISKGIASVISESLVTLALKKDYPTACHVLSQELLKNIDASENSRSKCIVEKPWGGGCLIRQEQQFPAYSYYWPKYFVEVSQKGNDPFPAFAAGNKLYAANRVLANSISSFVDLKGPYTLAAKVILGAGAIKTATSGIMGQGFDFHVSSNEISQAANTAVLTPFEKLRLRANQTPDMTSYEVNLWPVGLSATIAKQLTVCGEGGFQWPIPGVPMTCPVAMSRDAWPYWDSGMLDYLNPNAIRGIATATNPAACIADNLASVAFDEYGPKASTESISKDPGNEKQKKLADLPTNFRGVGMCSFPVLGDSAAILDQTLALKDSFKGPWCTLWGPIVPRMSTHAYVTDFGFANAALKFKLMAHDLFGVPRGTKERWTLAYPWEEQVSDAFLDTFGALGEMLEGLGIKKVSEEFVKTPGMGRSTILMPPGDPRMLDVFSVKQLAQDAKNFAREIVYLAGLNTAASEVERQTLKAFQQEHNQQQVSPNDLIASHKSEISDTVDDTAREKGEPVYVKKVYCHAKGEKQGLFTRSESQMTVPGYEDNRFERGSNSGQCHNSRGGSCIDRHPITGRCRRPESIFYVSFERWELSHYRKVQNPQIYVVDPAKCDYKDHRTPNTHHRHFTCSENLRLLGQKDTKEHPLLPDPKEPEAVVGRNTETGRAVAKAAQISTWVGAEIARAKYEEISGRSLLPGKKRVYTIFEKISCEPKTPEGREIYRKQIPGGWVWNSCGDAVKLEVRKYFQTKLLRRVCDKVLSQKLGEPFK